MVAGFSCHHVRSLERGLLALPAFVSLRGGKINYLPLNSIH
jgi:hypothetical protein